MSLLIGAFFLFYYRDFMYGLCGFAFGMFLDADHLVDYLLYLTKFHRPFQLKEFLSGTYFADWQKFVTPLHSWEIVLGSLIMYTGFGYKISLVTAAALAGHYVVDYLTNDVNPYAYFLAFRARFMFKKAMIKR